MKTLMKSSTARLVVVCLAVALSLLAIVTLAPSAPAPRDAPPAEFSAQRALDHLEAIARQPHPLGSEEHERVRRYLADQLRNLGLEPELQRAIAVRSGRGLTVAGEVTNVMARLLGRERGRSVLLVAHYDTVPGSAGAGDNSAGVATLLETLRAVRQGPALRNDLIVLFTDAEEVGLLGASAFVEQHPWARDVGLVVNFEGRGTGGPSIMFETSPDNGPLIAEWRRAVPRPVAFSYSYEIYKVMPNDTDFTVFRPLGAPGFNFAFIHGPTAYHTAQDSLANLDLGSVQHHGEQALALVHRFGDADLNRQWRGPNAVYFNLLGPLFISYPGGWVWPLTVLLGVGLVGVLIAAFRRGRASLGGALVAVLVALLGGVLTALLLALLARFVWSAGGYNFRLWYGWASNSLNLLGLALVAVGVSVGIYRLVSRKLRSDNVVAGGLIVWWLLTVLITVVAPGASFLFAFPLTFALIAAASWLHTEPGELVPRGLVALLALAAAATALIWPVNLALVGVAMGSTAVVPVGLFVFLLLFALMAPLLALGGVPRRPWRTPALWATAGLVLLAILRLSSGHGPGNLRPDSLLYALDTESGSARWLSLDRSPDAWTSQFLTRDPERAPLPGYLGRPRPALSHPAPAAPLAGAAVEVLAERAAEGSRTLELALRWPYDVDRALIYLRSQGEIRGLELAGREVSWEGNFGPGDEPHRTGFYYYAPPAGGVRLTVEVAGDSPLVVEAVAQQLGLPALPDAAPTPRPEGLMPQAGWYTDSTFVRSVTSLAPGSGAAASAEEAPPEVDPEGTGESATDSDTDGDEAPRSE